MDKKWLDRWAQRILEQAVGDPLICAKRMECLLSAALTLIEIRRSEFGLEKSDPTPEDVLKIVGKDLQSEGG